MMLDNVCSLLARLIRVPDAGIKLAKSVLATYRLTGRFYPLKVRIYTSGIKCTFRKAKSAQVYLRGTLSIGGWLGNDSFVYISVGPGGTFELNGDFSLGSGSRISVGDNARLIIGGCEEESASGFTENATILCQKSITIGKDFIGAWGLFITDSDHHQYGDANPPMDVSIGDHVWMCPNSSVLKNSSVGRDCVILQGTVVTNANLPEKSLVGCNPGVRITEAKEWHR
jgi:acetyltransferase-like isoleucine patch superfamily enzyme